MASEDSRFPLLWLRFRDITALDTPGHSNSAQHVDWLPPECPAGFVTDHEYPWHILTPRSTGNMHHLSLFPQKLGVELDELPAKIVMYHTTSIFYSTELSSFLEVPYDCTTEHVAKKKAVHEKDGWMKITFYKHDDTENAFPRNPYLWCIGHAHKKKQMDSDVYITDSWDELLLPSSFHNGIQRKNSLPTCELAGRLTLIFGLLAFTTTREKSYYDRISESFRHAGTSHYFPTWQTGLPQHEGCKFQVSLTIQASWLILVFSNQQTRSYCRCRI